MAFRKGAVKEHHLSVTADIEGKPIKRDRVDPVRDRDQNIMVYVSKVAEKSIGVCVGGVAWMYVRGKGSM